MKINKKNLILWPLSTITTFVTNIHIHGHGNSMMDPAQRAELVKIILSFSLANLHNFVEL